MADIFVSYAHEDLPVAKRLVDALKAHGWTVWWDRTNLIAGQNFLREINRQISDAKTVIVIWSKNVHNSDWVLGEAEQAREEKKLIPIRIDETKLLTAHRNMQTIDFTFLNKDNNHEVFSVIADAFAKLLQALKTLISDNKEGGILDIKSVTLIEQEAQPRDSDTAAQTAFNAGNYEEAFEFAETAAKNGSQVAQYILGELYHNGYGIEEDHVLAAEWLHRSAESGYVAAQHYLGWLYAYDEVIPHDYKKAAKWFSAAADQNHADAQYCIGHLYLNALGKIQDPAEAKRWFLYAAEQKHPDAQYQLGLLYSKGDRVTHDYKEAEKWFREAAIQGHSDGQYRLAILQLGGFGVDVNRSDAIHWLRKAANQEHKNAKYKLMLLEIENQRNEEQKNPRS
jgi:TPR repeat protein